MTSAGVGAWVDRVTGAVAPVWTLKRQKARIASQALAAAWDFAEPGRRTQNWRRSAGDANAAIGEGIHPGRMHARDLVRNNPWAASAVETIVNGMVGYEIATEPDDPKAAKRWQQWSGTTACDAAGRHDLGGLQKLVARTVVTAGECLVRRRWRRFSDNLPIPMQLQVLEPDHLDTMKTGPTADGGYVVQGVEFDPIGRRRAYWLYTEHPGSITIGRGRFTSVSIPASEVLHIFKGERPGQVRGITWFAPVILKAKDFDEYEDATLMKQKIAACLAILTTDVDGTTPALGQAQAGMTPGGPELDEVRPGGIHNIAAGRSVEVVQPPSVNEHDAYSKTVLRAMATGWGIAYEDLTGDYSEVSYSSARMSRLRTWPRVEDRRWNMLIPQFCEPVFLWAMQAAAIIDDVKVPETDLERWTAEPLPMIEPDREGIAYGRLMRNLMMSLDDVLRERGYRPKKVLERIKKDTEELDRLGLVSDADPRKTTQGGQLQGAAAGEGGSPAAAALERFVEDIVRKHLAEAKEASLMGAEQ